MGMLLNACLGLASKLVDLPSKNLAALMGKNLKERAVTAFSINSLHVFNF